MREPKLNEVPAIEPVNNSLISQIREYELITPLFGGGVIPGEADPATIVRGSEIRGHLRFWWRATRGGQFNSDLKQMKKAEDDLWGAASTAKKPLPSHVQIRVDILDQGRPFVVRDRQGSLTEISHFKSPYSYVAFPLKKGQTVREGIRFKLVLTFPIEQSPEVEAALWAWETFGGIGARTRRGFGSLHCIGIEENGKETYVKAYGADEVTSSIRANLQKHIVNHQWPKNVPHLSHKLTFKVTDPNQKPLTIWLQLIKALKDFRQDRHGRFGRSKWPEPDEIRRLTGQSLPGHRRPVSTIPKFPRAAFGLPIVFHFKDEDEDNPTNPDADPQETILQGKPSPNKTYDRLASPLILRPLVCANNQVVGLAIILETPHVPPTGLILKNAPKDPSVDLNLTPGEAGIIPGLNGNLDVLKAFLDTL